MDPRLVAKGLLDYDPDIVEIAQFGSSVYAPKHARDLGLLVITSEGVQRLSGRGSRFQRRSPRLRGGETPEEVLELEREIYPARRGVA